MEIFLTTVFVFVFDICYTQICGFATGLVWFPNPLAAGSQTSVHSWTREKNSLTQTVQMAVVVLTTVSVEKVFVDSGAGF